MMLKLSNFKNYFVFTFLFLIFCLLAYGSSLQSEFLIDDHLFIQGDHRQTFQTLKDFFTTNNTQHYYPIADILNAYIFKTFGDNPFPYRLLNVVLFALTCSALYFYLQQMGISQKTSLIASTLFLVHPMNAHCVNYITANFMFVFAIFLMIAHIFFLFSIDAVKYRKTFFVISLFTFGLSLLTFEGALLFPLYLANDLFFRRKEKLIQIVKRCPPFVMILFIYLLIWKKIAGPHTQAFSLLLSSLDQWPATISSFCYLVYWYVANLFWPRGIVLIYHTELLSQGVLGLIAAFLLVVSFIFVFYLFRKDRMKLFSLTWFMIGLILLIPAAFAHFDIGLIIEPHWFFFSSVGLFLFVALILSEGMSRSKNTWLWPGIILGIVLFLFTGTQNYNAMAKTEESYYQYWQKVSPGNNIILTQLGKIRYEQKRYDEALVYLRQALAPNNGLINSLIYGNIALVYDMKNDWEQALFNLEKSVEIDPDNAQSFSQLGSLFAEKNKFIEAEQNFIKSLEINPYLISANKNLISLYVSMENHHKAIRLYERYAQLPLLSLKERIDAHVVLTILNLKEGQVDRQFDHISEILKLDPSGDGYFNLCEAVYAAGYSGFSKELLDNYIKHFRPSKDAFLLYGVLLGNRNEHEQAIDIWKKGLALDPSDQRFKQYIEKARQLMAKPSL